MVRWDGLDKPGIEFMLRAMCPGGDFVYPPPMAKNVLNRLKSKSP